jgi:hypothetical protein
VPHCAFLHGVASLSLLFFFFLVCARHEFFNADAPKRKRNNSGPQIIGTASKIEDDCDRDGAKKGQPLQVFSEISAAPTHKTAMAGSSLNPELYGNPIELDSLQRGANGDAIKYSSIHYSLLLLCAVITYSRRYLWATTAWASPPCWPDSRFAPISLSCATSGRFILAARLFFF